MDLNHDTIAIVAGAAFVIIEFWLGKTDKVKAGSTLELAVNALKAALKILKGPTKE